MRRKAVTAWCMWEPGWFPDLTTACETQSLSRHQATLRGWSPKYVIRVEIRPARKAKAKRRSRAGGSR